VDIFENTTNEKDVQMHIVFSIYSKYITSLLSTLSSSNAIYGKGGKLGGGGGGKYFWWVETLIS
jgi:hypothetical protein